MGCETVIGSDCRLQVQNVLLAHESIFPPGFSYANYKEGRKCYGIAIVCSGEAVYESADYKFTATTGNLLFLPPDVAYTVTNFCDVPFHHYTVNFNLSEVPLPELLGNGAIVVTETKNVPAYQMLFEAAASRWQAKNSFYELICTANLYEILYCFLNEYMNRNIDINDRDRVQPAKKFIDEYYMRAISADDLAEMCGLSKTHLCRIFKRLYGLTPLIYQIKIRISKAKDLLSCKIYTVKEVAYMTGFEDPNYFSKFFKKYTGFSPHDYKKTY